MSRYSWVLKSSRRPASIASFLPALRAAIRRPSFQQAAVVPVSVFFGPLAIRGRYFTVPSCTGIRWHIREVAEIARSTIRVANACDLCSCRGIFNRSIRHCCNEVLVCRGRHGVDQVRCHGIKGAIWPVLTPWISSTGHGHGAVAQDSRPSPLGQDHGSPAKCCRAAYSISDRTRDRAKTIGNVRLPSTTAQGFHCSLGQERKLDLFLAPFWRPWPIKQRARALR